MVSFLVTRSTPKQLAYSSTTGDMGQRVQLCLAKPQLSSVESLGQWLPLCCDHQQGVCWLHPSFLWPFQFPSSTALCS